MTHKEIEALAATIAPVVAVEVARQLVDRIGEHRSREFLDASELARVLGVERDWVYAHQEQLGAIRLGKGRKPRLRFEVSRAVEGFDAMSANNRPSAPQRTPAPRPRRLRRRHR